MMVDEPIIDSPTWRCGGIRKEIRHGHVGVALRITASLPLVATTLLVGFVEIRGERYPGTVWLTDLIAGILLAFATLVLAALIVVLTGAVGSVSTRRIAEI